ncbi:MAG: DUF2461 domain-containing protein [Planctomycetota bacterium]
MPGIARETTRFLKQLAKNNDRDWFKSHADEWEAARSDFLALIAALQPGLEKVSEVAWVDASKTGGSMFRIHRDVRFSKDKSPYKTNLSAVFPHAGVEGKVDAPCFYLQVSPTETMVAAGPYGPDAKSLKLIREAIADDPAAWKRATSGKKFDEHFAMTTDKLKRPPKGFDADHPAIEEIKRTRFAAMTKPISSDVVHGGGFDKEIVRLCKIANPLVAFVCRAMKLPW